MIKAKLSRYVPLTAALAGMALGLSSNPLGVSASAGDGGAVALAGTVTLPVFPTAAKGLGTKNGCSIKVAPFATAAAAGVTFKDTDPGPSVPSSPKALTSAQVVVTWYTESGNVATGAAQGYIAGNGGKEYFNWTREGLTAVILLGDVCVISTGNADGGAIGLFVPEGTTGPNLKAVVATVGAFD
jgi:hypothetical protein